MSHRPRVTPTGVLKVDRALDGHAALGRLLQRVQASRARHEAIRHLLPEPLRAQVRAGPLDDEGWTLLVPSGAAAAKLRQLLPGLADALRAAGQPVAAIRVRVQASDASR
jgi:hypothetical protein